MMKAFFFVVASMIALAGRGQSASDKEAVEKVVLAFQDDFNDGGFKNAHTYTTAGWEHINPLGGLDKGRDHVLKVVRSVHETFLKGVTMTLEEISVRFIAPNVAIADAVHKISDYTTPDGMRHQNERQIKTYVVVKEYGKWLLTHDHSTIIRMVDRPSN